RLRDVHLRLHHLVDPKPEVCHGDLVFDVVVDAVDSLELEAGEVQNGFAHGLTGNRPGIDACAPDDFALLDHNNLAAAFGCLDRSALAGRTGTDDNDVVYPHEMGWALRPPRGRSVFTCRR